MLTKDKKDTTEVLWQSWRAWAKQNDVSVGTETAFSESLREAGFVQDKYIRGSDGKYHRGWKGVAKGRDVGPEFVRGLVD